MWILKKKIISVVVFDLGNFRDCELGCFGLYSVKRFINKKFCSGYLVDGWLMVLFFCICLIVISYVDLYLEEKSS